MIAALVILAFDICAPNGAACIDGFTIAASCEAAETWLREGLQPGQVLHVHECRPYRRDDWQAMQ